MSGGPRRPRRDDRQPRRGGPGGSGPGGFRGGPPGPRPGGGFRGGPRRGTGFSGGGGMDRGGFDRDSPHFGDATPGGPSRTPPPMRDEEPGGPGGDRPRRPWEDRGPRPPGGRGPRPPGSWGPRPPGNRGPGPADGRGPETWRRDDLPPRPVRPGAPAPPLEEGEELVAGRRPVEEAFAAGRPARRLLVTPQRRQALERIVLHATTLRIPIVEVEGGSLTALAGFDGHQGVAVVVDARRFASVEDMLARAIERAEAPFVLVLDSLEDPQNVGTLLRTAEAAGVHGVVFPTERQAPLSPAAVKASAGATEHLLLAPVDDLPGMLTDLRLRGVRIVGSDSEAALEAREADLRGPIALVVGSEGHGLSPAVRRRCDLFVRLPMRGSIGSLNAAVAGSILLFEVLGQRATPATPVTPTPDQPLESPGKPPRKPRTPRPRRAGTDATPEATAEAAPEAKAEDDILPG